MEGKTNRWNNENYIPMHTLDIQETGGSMSLKFSLEIGFSLDLFS